MSKLESNTTELEEVLAMANALPDAGGGSDGVVVARFSSQDWSVIHCESHSALELHSHFDQGRCPILAHIIIEPQDGPIQYITATCHEESGQIVVYDGYSGYMWVNSDGGHMFYEF